MGVHESAFSRMETLTVSAMGELAIATFFLLGRSPVLSLLRCFSDMISLLKEGPWQFRGWLF